MKRSQPLERHTPLQAKTPLARTSNLSRSSLSVSASHQGSAARQRQPRLAANGGLTDSARYAKEEMERIAVEAEARGWLGCGDLVSPSLRKSAYFKRLPVEKRFCLTFTVAESGCWIWQGSLKGNGYGQFRYNGKNGYAHRAAYTFFRGQIPDGMTVDHQCHNRAGGCAAGNSCVHRRCVNPNHLELTDGIDNARRGVLARTKCPRGHDLVGDNRRDLARCQRCLSQDVLQQSDKRSIVHLLEGKHGARAKFSDADLEIMRGLKSSGQPLALIANQFGVTAKYLSAVLSGSRKRKRKHPGPTPAVRRVVARRSGGTCEFEDCLRQALHQHHRRPRRMGSSMAPESNLPANLLHLCFEHHEWVESNRELAYADGLLLHMNDDPTAVPARTRHGRVWLCDDGTTSTTPPPVTA